MYHTRSTALARRCISAHHAVARPRDDGGRLVMMLLTESSGISAIGSGSTRDRGVGVELGSDLDARAAGRPPADRSGTGRRILVVDDNHDSAISLALWLRLKGFETQVAHDGIEALAATERFRPEIVLLDIGLPKLDGYEVCRRIRAEEWGRRMQVIALTGWSQEEAKQATADAGFDSHLIKPVDLAVLMAVLSSQLP